VKVRGEPSTGDLSVEELERLLGPGDLELAGVLHGESAFVGPEQVVVDLTNRCNNNCIGCWTRSPLLRDLEPSAQWQSQEIPYDNVIHLLNDLYDLKTRRVRFTGGGEPLLHPRLDEILVACKQRRLITCITTNGSLLDEERVKLFADLPVDELAVSLWAASPEMYSRTHPSKTERTFEKARHALELLCSVKKVRPRVTLSNVLFAMNYEEAELMYSFARRVGADAVYFTVLDPVPGRTDGLLIRPEHVGELNLRLDRVEESNRALPERQRLELENWEGFRRRIDSIKEQQRGEYDAAVIDEIPCYVGWIFCRVMANGDVAPCCRGTEMPMGNINTDGFKKTWSGERYNEFRRRAKTLSKQDPYFAPIQCNKTCDNLMHNEAVHRRLGELSPERRAMIERYISLQDQAVER
jgi:MoaA/NifB/PqqE/SkfB family radical SAM enzyme